ncbi:pilus assembly protein N-terminal domain-containing protein [Duganella zoogloeoides]|uniref:Pilus assembly protein N-terminal domain-containing protein n=1 Tax=Duganella zoogloeoides TaxID=75659 RepID=A0ABZ0Y3F7_9BURK|nr:pilus assembly protein N-terminal domain-containing protein [Duganella zoogloeoides]WQH06582.1 pilus assembly protein N-terminal domain-containing protein [Duganella zoogloeoides]
MLVRTLFICRRPLRRSLSLSLLSLSLSMLTGSALAAGQAQVQPAAAQAAMPAVPATRSAVPAPPPAARAALAPAAPASAPGAVAAVAGAPALPAAAAGAATAVNTRNPISAAGTMRPARATPKVVEPYAPISAGTDAVPVPEIELYVGESRVFPTPGVARIAVGNGQILSASALDGKEIIMFGNGVGVSSLFVWNEDGRYQRIKVTIVPGETARITREVAAFLRHIPKATASVVGDKVIVEGDELSDNDREKVAELAKRYPQIVNFTSPIGWEQTVLMDVKVVEFPKNELRELGLKWNPTGGGAIGAIWSPAGRGDNGASVGGRQITITSPAGQASPITNIDTTKGVVLPSSLTIMSAINMGLNAQLNLLEQNGTAAILAEPQLSTRSGAKASFLAGGEFPYSVSNLNGTTIVFKPYGIKLDIEPKVGRNGVIRAEIDSEVSSLDTSVSSVGGPALLTRRTKTEFNVRTGETIVLSGLLQRTTGTDIDKVPLLGDIPVLGALFRSKRFQNKETELVVFVTPTIVDARAPGLQDRVQRTNERLGTQMGPSPYLSDPLQPGTDPARVFVPVAPVAQDAAVTPTPSH